MERVPKGLYTLEFRAEAVKLVLDSGLSVDEAAKRLSIPKSSLGNWARASKEGNLAKIGQGQRVATEIEVFGDLSPGFFTCINDW
jgi:transposase